MPKIREEKIDTLDEKIIVTLDSEDYEDDYEKSINNYSKNAEMKGFKKGKVPKPLVKKMHGKAILADMLMRKAYNEANTYVRDNDIQIFAQPMLVDMPDFDGDEKEYSFGFEIGLRPEFEIDMLQGKQEFPQLHVDATDEMVEDDIDRLRNRMGEMTEPESITDDNTVLNVTLQETDTDGNPLDGSEPVEDSFLLSYVDEPARKDFMDKKVGDTINLKYGDAFSDKLNKVMSKDLNLDPQDENNKDRHYNVTIDRIAFVEPADLNDEFYAKVLPGREFQSEDEFKAAIKEDIQKQWDEASINVLDNTLYEALVHETKMDLPTDFLKKWLQYREETPLSDEEVSAAYPSFEHQLKWSVISDKIIKDNDLKVDQEEVKQEMENQIRSYFGMSSGMDESFIDNFLDKSMKDPEQYQKTANDIMTKKVMAVVRNGVKVKEETVTADEFRDKSQELSHKYHNH